MSSHPSSPFEFFQTCFDRAHALNLLQPNSMTLITATPQGRPSGRVVLLKEVIPDTGFRFFTNYESRKAKELLANPYAELLFYWSAFGRQIRIEGKVQKSSRDESDQYFRSRPRMSQIGAIASLQSRPLGSAEELKSKVDQLVIEFDGKEIQRPENWGGFDFIADRFEFWEDRSDRLHERITYEREGDQWRTGRLWP